MNIAIISPVLNDWQSARQLCGELEGVLALTGHTASIWFVDDGSTEKASSAASFPAGRALLEVNVIELHGNQGHQRAIATGLGYLANQPERFAGFLLMDSDGEDLPSSVPSILAAANSGAVVVASRAKRYERWMFRAGYSLYKILFYLCTGKSIGFGNFLFLPEKYADSLVHSQYTASHVAATVVRLGLPCKSLKVDRGPRYHGSSRMNLVSLVLHGLSAISVFSEFMLTRVILFTGSLVGLCVAGIIAVFTIRLATNLAVPGWATYVSLFLLMISIQAVFASLFLCFLVLSLRQGISRTPALDSQSLVKGVRKLSA